MKDDHSLLPENIDVEALHEKRCGIVRTFFYGPQS
jgi:hypothetical protein